MTGGGWAPHAGEWDAKRLKLQFTERRGKPSDLQQRKVPAAPPQR